MKSGVDITASLKRIASAYSTSKKDSDDERSLYKLLCAKIFAEILVHDLGRRPSQVLRGRRATSDVTRQRVLHEQAIRARLAKIDMGPEGRLRTLQEAQQAGIELDNRQRRQLRALVRSGVA